MTHLSGPADAADVEAFIDRWLSVHEAEMVAELRELLAIESVEGEPEPGRPFGDGVARALERVQALARRLGMTTVNADGYAVHAEMGSGPELVGVLCHVDVVPAGNGWSVPPFAGVIKDGRLYGRGAIDDKGPTVAALYGAAAVLASRTPLSRRVRLIVGGDEESGFECLRHYFSRYEKPQLAFSPDAVFPVVFAEKGILDFRLARSVSPSAIVRLQGGLRPNVVPDLAEAELALPPGEDPDEWAAHLRAEASGRRARLVVGAPGGEGRRHVITVRSEGVATHGSTPEKGVNAVAELLAVLARADRGRGLLDPDGAAAFLAQAGTQVYGRGLGIAHRDDVSGALTANLGVVRWQDGRVEATFNVRYPVSIPSAQGLLEAIRAVAGPAGFEVVDVEDNPPHHVPPDSFLVRTLMDVYRRVTGDDLGPLAIGGGTYARLLPAAVAFGPVFPFQGIVPHERDEHIDLDHLRRLARIYGYAVWALAR